MEEAGFFKFEEPTGAGYKGGSDKNLEDIAKYVSPILRKNGFDYCLDKQDNTSNKVRIFAVGKEPFIRTQIIVIESLHNIGSRANSNITNKLVDATTEQNRIEHQLAYLREKKVHLFLFVKRGEYFIFLPYTDIPQEHYVLTYRAKPDRKNRIYIPAEYLPKFKRISELKNVLNTYLK